MTLRSKLIASAGVMLLVSSGGWTWLTWGLPSVGELRSQLWSRYVPRGRSTWVPITSISTKLQTAVVVWEDPTFYHHHGISYEDTWRALRRDVETRSYARGGSTITQQVAKNLFLKPEKTLRRKLREAILARRLEQVLSKEEILEIYLNIAEWGNAEDGNTVAGCEEASRLYFAKPAAELNWAEAALLTGLLPNPSRRSPLVDPETARGNRRAVLEKLLRAKELTATDFFEAVSDSCREKSNPKCPNSAGIAATR